MQENDGATASTAPSIVFSCIIPAKDPNDPLLRDLIKSIRAQDFSQDKIEIIVVTEGDSESAKAIGIRKARGEICAMFCADNVVINQDAFSKVWLMFRNNPKVSAVYSRNYYHDRNDRSINRYFSLIGGNDPVCYYLGKNDRIPCADELYRSSEYQPSYGCNGTFYRSELIKKTDLDHYYPMDNAMEVPGIFLPMESVKIAHKTISDNNLIKFLIRRYRYARDLYCNRSDRRWRMLDTKEDYFRLALFCLYSVTFIQPLLVSIRGFSKVRDFAWFWHPIVCVSFVLMYSVLALRTTLRQVWLSLHSTVQKAFRDVYSH